MANYYSLFSTRIPVKEEKQRAWLMKHLQEWSSDLPMEEPEYGGPINAQDEGEKGVWVYSDDNFDLDTLIIVLCEFQRRFKRKDTIIITVATTCSRPILDSFGGHGVVIQYGAFRYLSLNEELEKLARLMMSQQGGPRGGQRYA